MILADEKYKTLKIMGTWNDPSQEKEKILDLKTEIEKLKRVRKETSSTPPGNQKRQPSDKKEIPNWLLLNDNPSNINESRHWNDHTFSGM